MTEDKEPSFYEELMEALEELLQDLKEGKDHEQKEY